ncbi:MAG: Mut7-C RNAse domain-containing protein, partial [Acidobacteria bacterium]|nr:Mut7-C RNAse domain-containing protein [Acidobacteriota bacterium]
MLGSVARKLRIFGFDTLYVADADDAEILKLGIEQSRIILTADKELFKRAVGAGAQGVLVSGGSDLEDLVHILSKNGIMSIGEDWIGTRCSVCNGMLEERAPDQVRKKVPEKVGANHNEFFECVECGKVYWEGSHFKRIESLVKSVDSRLR